MKFSADIKEISAAILRIHSEVEIALKDSTNPHFKSKYADIESIQYASKEALARNNIAIIQEPCTIMCPIKGAIPGLGTLLLHSSGQWIYQEAPLPMSKTTPQEAGSSITYFRRYAQAGSLNILQSDDDGETAEKAENPNRQQPVKSQPASDKLKMDHGKYIIYFGKYKGRTIDSLHLEEITGYISHLEKMAKDSGKDMSGGAAEFCSYAKSYLNTKSLLAKKPDTQYDGFDVVSNRGPNGF